MIIKKIEAVLFILRTKRLFIQHLTFPAHSLRADPLLYPMLRDSVVLARF
jgi:hypothetical protein